MKQSKTKKQLLLLSCVVGGMLLSGCADDGYKISSVDATLSIGNGNLNLPTNNSVVVTLDDILDLGSTDIITVDNNGDYKFGKAPENVSDVKVRVNSIHSNGSPRTLAFPAINLPASIQALAGQTIKPSDYGVSLAQGGDISLIDYQFNVPDDVESLNYVVLGNGVSMKIEITLSAVTKLNKLEVTLPHQFVVENLNGGTFDNTTNKLTLTNVTVSSGKVTLNFLLKQIKAGLDGNHVFTVHDNVHMNIDIAELKVPSAATLPVSGVVTIGSMDVTAANGRFNPTIDPQAVGSTTINSLPDFLTDARVVTDIDNPQIWLTLVSNLPIDGYAEAKLSSTTSQADVILSKAKGNELPIAANSTTRLVICRKAPANLSGYKAVIAPDLTNLIKKVQEGMKINIDITKYESQQTSDAMVELGHDYLIKPDYTISAPLVLGDEANIIYNSTEDNWNKDLKDLELTKGATLQLTASVNNGVPANLEINVKPLGVGGTELTTLTVKPIENKVKAGETAGTIKYEIIDPEGAGLKKLNGIQYELLVTAPSAASEKGKVLNKNQKITITTTDLNLSGKLIIDAN
jgi:hypothetical protein